MKQPDLYYFETIKNDVTGLRPVKVHRKYSVVVRILHTKFDWACDIALWF